MVCRAGRCPPPEALDGYEPRQTSKIYAADGRFIAELGLERRTLVKLRQHSASSCGTRSSSTEDKRFYQPLAASTGSAFPARSSPTSRTRSFAEGFSTITMQLARNIFPERISRDKVARFAS